MPRGPLLTDPAASQPRPRQGSKKVAGASAPADPRTGAQLFSTHPGGVPEADPRPAASVYLWIAMRIEAAIAACLLMAVLTGCQKSASTSTAHAVENRPVSQRNAAKKWEPDNEDPVAYVQNFDDEGRGYAVMVCSRPATDADTIHFDGDEPDKQPDTMLARIAVYYNGKSFDIPQRFLTERFNVYPGEQLVAGGFIVIESEDRKHLGIGIGGADGYLSWGSTWVVDADGNVSDKIQWANDEPIESLVRRHLSERAAPE